MRRRDSRSLHWRSGTSQLLRLLLAGRTVGPVFLTDRRAPRRAAPSTKRRCVTGTNSSERHTGRFFVISLALPPRSCSDVF